LNIYPFASAALTITGLSQSYGPISSSVSMAGNCVPVLDATELPGELRKYRGKRK